MRLVMLARNAALHSHQRLIAAAVARGHTLDVINTLHVHMNITSNHPVLRFGGKALPIYDAVIPRIGASVTNYGLAVLRQFEMQGVFPLNESVAIGRARDKLRALQLLARAGIGLPITAFAHGPRKAEEVIKGICKFVAVRDGGAGAIRDFANMVVEARGVDPFSLPTQ